ncbi:MAG: PAS domain S-box protein [Chitinophagaceae bacterium]|nr:MAG: PAS domain S-box protein [Chitinophagaceae bacterium]
MDQHHTHTTSHSPPHADEAAPVPGFYGDLSEKARLIIDAALDAIVGIDTGGNILLWNAQAEALFGWRREEVPGAPFTETLVPARLREQQQALGHYLRTGEGASRNRPMELTATDRAGREFAVELVITPIKEEGQEFYCAFIRDLSERKEAERRLLEGEQKFTSLVQNSSDMIAILDAGGSYLYASPSVTAILGYTAEHFQKRHISEFIHPGDAGRVQEAFAQLLAHDKATVAPYRFRAADGSWRWIESYGSNLLHDPAICGLVINSHEVTDRIRLQEEFEQKTRALQKEMTAAVIQAQESERAQLGQELHDNVNQVLTTVKLYIEMLRDGLDGPGATVGRALTHLQDCINEIRSISKRLSAPTLGSIGLSDSLRELVQSINLTGRISVRHCVEGLADGDISRDVHLALYRIVQEALNNIIKYAEADSAAILVSRVRQQLSLQIYDNGRGFDSSARRPGIGITNMRTRAEHLNGTFHLESTPGKGTMIQVSIPLG